VHELLDDIDGAADAGLYYLALVGALTVPDMCAALAAKNGRTDETKYKAWARDHLTDGDRQDLTPAELYRFRCSMVHQGSAFYDRTAGRVMFLEPAPNGNRFRSSWIEDAHLIDLLDLCHEMTAAARRWLDDHGADARVQANLERFIRRHPAGISPYIIGAPVIG
jgi:hypothetical protein